MVDVHQYIKMLFEQTMKGNRTPKERFKAQIELVVAYDKQLNNKLNLLDIIKQRGLVLSHLINYQFKRKPR